MDAPLAAAARALASGDPLGALHHVALRGDPPALALRGIALAQLGDLERARALLRRAARAFRPEQELARARCELAEADVALAMRDLDWPDETLESTRQALLRHGDLANAAHARLLHARRLLLLGRADDAAVAIAGWDQAPLPAAARAVHALAAAGIALRRLQAEPARLALAQARAAARESGIGALQAEADALSRLLEAPAARLTRHGAQRLLRLDEVEALMASDALVADTARQALRSPMATVDLSRRPVLFALARQLAEAWPGDAPREALIAAVFRLRRPDETHRARLRVEAGRLRVALKGLAEVRASRRGYALALPPGCEAVTLAPPDESAHPELQALLADGQPWSSAALALALGASQRSVQRALETLAAAGQAQPLGQGRARRWAAPPPPGCATVLLLPPLSPAD